MLHNQIDGLLSAIAQRPAERGSGSDPETEPGPELHLGPELGNDFKIAMVGDSTMRVRSYRKSHSHTAGSGFQSIMAIRGAAVGPLDSVPPKLKPSTAQKP